MPFLPFLIVFLLGLPAFAFIPAPLVATRRGVSLSVFSPGQADAEQALDEVVEEQPGRMKGKDV